VKYVALLVGYHDEARDWASLSDAERAAEMATHGAFGEAVQAREGCEVVGGEALTGGDAATVMRRVDGRQVLTDGPFSEATEGIGGFYVLEAPDLDVAVELLSELTDYVIEIRPVDESVG
jgi:hypothetical protein